MTTNPRHDKPYVLSMANAGSNTNGSQYVYCIKSFSPLMLTPPYLRFFITFDVTSHLDGKHVVFGEVADDESKAIIRKIESKVKSTQPRQMGKIFIEKAGELPG